MLLSEQLSCEIKGEEWVAIIGEDQEARKDSLVNGCR